MIIQESHSFMANFFLIKTNLHKEYKDLSVSWKSIYFQVPCFTDYILLKVISLNHQPGRHSVQFTSLQLLSFVRLFVTPWTAACQAFLSITNSMSLLKLMSTESVMLSSDLILCRPPSLPAFNFSQHQGLFQWVSSSYHVAQVLELQLQHQSFQWIFRTDFL